jgi:hypothetical protein
MKVAALGKMVVKLNALVRLSVNAHSMHIAVSVLSWAVKATPHAYQLPSVHDHPTSSKRLASDGLTLREPFSSTRPIFRMWCSLPIASVSSALRAGSDKACLTGQLECVTSSTAVND